MLSRKLDASDGAGGRGTAGSVTGGATSLVCCGARRTVMMAGSRDAPSSVGTVASATTALTNSRRDTALPCASTAISAPFACGRVPFQALPTRSNSGRALLNGASIAIGSNRVPERCFSRNGLMVGGSLTTMPTAAPPAMELTGMDWPASSSRKLRVDAALLVADVFVDFFADSFTYVFAGLFVGTALSLDAVSNGGRVC